MYLDEQLVRISFLSEVPELTAQYNRSCIPDDVGQPRPWRNLLLLCCFRHYGFLDSL
jgi:hypothetical protein